MPTRWMRAFFPAGLAVAAAAVLGCAHGEAVDSPDIVLGEDWPPGVTAGTGLPPWLLPPMLRGQGGGPAPWLDDEPGDHADHEDDLGSAPPGDDELLAEPPDQDERGHEDFL